MVYEIRWRYRGSNREVALADDEGGWLAFGQGREARSLPDALDKFLINAATRYAADHDYEIREQQGEKVVWRGCVRDTGVPIEGTWLDGSACLSLVLAPYRRVYAARYRAAR